MRGIEDLYDDNAKINKILTEGLKARIFFIKFVHLTHNEQDRY